jgi:hypothetical protein
MKLEAIGKRIEAKSFGLKPLTFINIGGDPCN